MTPFDDLPLPHVDPIPRVGAILRGQRTGAIQLPPGVVPPVGARLRFAWERRREGRPRPGGETEAEPAEAEAAPLEVDPPETYGEHGELLHAHTEGEAQAAPPHLDLKA